MEWMNPLILEWVKENEGKNQSDFMKELMSDYKTRREGVPADEGTPVGRILPSVDGIKDYVERIHLGETYDKLRSQLDGLLDTLKDEYGKLVVKIKELEAGTRLREALSDFSSELKPRLHQLLDTIKEKFKDLTDAVERLRTREQSTA